MSAPDLRALRSVCSLGIGELQRRTRVGEAILEFEPVSSRATLEVLCSAIEAGALPPHIRDCLASPGSSPSEERISTEEFRCHLHALQDIATQTAIATQLERGHLQTPAEDSDPADERARNA